MVKPAQFTNRISYITLGVGDLPRAVAFYRDVLGLATKGIVGSELNHGAVAFFDFQPGLALALWPRHSISAECGVPLGTPDPAGMMLAHNVGSVQAVDDILAHVAQAGANITRAARSFPWGGYGGMFQDPDGHLWEVVWNPHDGSAE